MNEQQREVTELKATVARLEAMMTDSIRGNAAVDLARARRSQRWAMWAGSVGLCSLPVLGWAAVSLTEFQPNTPIVAADVNANFEALAVAVTELQDGRAGDRVLGSDVTEWTSTATSAGDPDAVVAELTVDVETHGRPVRVELIGNGEHQPFIAGETANQTAQFTYRLERRTAGVDVDWVTVDEFFFLAYAGGSSTSAVRLPPTVVTAVDTPAEGTTSYRVIAWNEPFGGQAGQQVDVARVRLAAQELAATAP